MKFYTGLAGRHRPCKYEIYCSFIRASIKISNRELSGVLFKSLRLFILMSRMVGSRILRNKIGTLTHLSAHHHHVHYTTSGGPPKSGGPLASPAVSSSAGVPLALASPPTVTSLPYNHLYQSHFPPYSPPLSSPTKSGVLF